MAPSSHHRIRLDASSSDITLPETTFSLQSRPADVGRAGRYVSAGGCTRSPDGSLAVGELNLVGEYFQGGHTVSLITRVGPLLDRPKTI